MGVNAVRGGWLCENPVRFSLNDGPMETAIHVVKYLVHARLDYWVLLQDCRSTLPWHSLFTFHLENSILSAHAKPSLENNSINLLISIGVVLKITVYIYSIKLKLCSL